MVVDDARGSYIECPCEGQETISVGLSVFLLQNILRGDFILSLCPRIVTSCLFMSLCLLSVTVSSL